MDSLGGGRLGRPRSLLSMSGGRGGRRCVVSRCHVWWRWQNAINDLEAEHARFAGPFIGGKTRQRLEKPWVVREEGAGQAVDYVSRDETFVVSFRIPT